MSDNNLSLESNPTETGSREFEGTAGLKDMVSESKSSAERIPETEATWYYFGLRGRVHWARPPRLIYRTSKDILPTPESQFNTFRSIKLVTVHDHAKLRENNLWDTIRDETAGILDQKKIKWTSIDLVRFRWEDGPGFSYKETITGAVTIWIGVVPYSTNYTKAFEASEEILKLLKSYGVDDIEIAFRESIVRPFSKPKPILPAPVSEFDPLHNVINCLTTALSLPIVALDSPYAEGGQGTLGFYFKVGEDLYGVTARHVLLPSLTGNDTYSDETSSSRKYVALMAPDAFDKYQATVQRMVRALEETLVKSPPEDQKKRENMEVKLAALTDFRSTLHKWFSIGDRIIGHVVWSPPISGLNAGEGEGYMRDVCVIKLDKDRFLPNMVGNAIEIERDIGKFMCSIYPGGRNSTPSEYPPNFELPDCGLYHIRRILPVAGMTESNVEDKDGQHTRFVVRSGPTKPRSTLGLLNGFLSRVRHYNLSGSFDSIEMAMFSNNPVDGPFASPNDSGAAVLGSNNEFVAQLTSGTGSADFCEIAYGTPMEWLWNKVIKPQFPEAILFFDASIT